MKNKNHLESLENSIRLLCLDEIEKISAEHPYLAICLLSIMIELYGKLISEETNSLETKGRSECYFNYAIRNLSAFSKYREISFNFYKQVRCSLAHTLLPDEDVSFGPNEHNLSNKVIGCKELLEDVKSAWKEVLQDTNAQNKLKMEKTCIDNTLTGGTESYISKGK